MEGQTFGQYRIECRLGAGGMGVGNPSARDTRLKRPVAIKLLNRTLSDAGARDDLLEEGRAASALNHPSICTVHGVEEIGDQTFIVMEYVEGAQLSGVIPTGGLPVETVLGNTGFRSRSTGSKHLHERGVIHGDLKTANVMVTPGGRVKVLYSGLARRAFAEAAEDTTLAENSAPNDAITGTLSYMAPEILHGEPRRASSDVWSLGVLLYEISCGELPFSGRTSFELTAAILRGPACAPAGPRPACAARGHPPLPCEGSRTAVSARGRSPRGT